MENLFIKEFEILGLFGYKDVCITFNHSTLIVIGENGFGKTSILNALNFLITHSYKRLLEIKFDAIRLSLGGKNFFYNRNLIEQYANYIDRKDNEEHSIIDFVRRNTDDKIFDTVVKMIQSGKRKEFYQFTNNDVFLRTIPGNVLYL